MEKRFQAIGCMIVVILIAAAFAFGSFKKSDTADTIIAAHKACEAQTGRNCS